MNGTGSHGFHMTGPMWMPTRPPSIGRMLTWHLQPIPVLVMLAVAAGVLYGWGVIRLERRGDGWPVGRTIFFACGITSFLLMVATGINGYGMELFSVHMVQHMTLSMVTPIPLLLGRPTTLALRAIPARSRTHHYLVRLLNSHALAFVTAPAFTIPLFILTLYGMYFTPGFDWLMGNWIGHDVMLVHFVVTGYLLFWPILALDPSPHRQPPTLRLLEAFLPVPFHAFFGVVVMGMTTLLTRSFAHPPSAWRISPVHDQQVGGGIAWGFTELPNLALVLALAVAWAASSRHAARRYDRSESRSNDAQLRAYNEWLQNLH
ncbi:cytochrome c oxidase assembly protein [Flexivirga sp. B27]